MTNNPHAAAHAAAVRNAQAQDDALDLLHKRTAAKRQLEQPTATEQPDAEQLADASAAQATDGTLLVASAEGAMAASGGDAAAGVVGATASADAASAAGVGAAGAAGTGAAAGTAAAVSPMAIGLGVLGVAAVGAAAGGGGGSSSAPAPSAQAKPGNDQLAQQEPGKQPNTNPQTPADGQPKADADKTGTDNGSQQPGNPGSTPSAEAQPGGDTPPPQSGASGPAIAQGTANAPKVAVDGETRLTNAKAAFEAAKPAGYDGEVKYIKITHIESSHDAKHPNARVVRWGNDDGSDKSAAAGADHDAQGLGGVHASLTRLASVVKAEAVNAQAGDADDKGGTVNAKVDAENGKAAAGGEQPVKLTGYEVITSDKPLTLAEARAEATRLGGKLLEIDDQDELIWLQRNLLGRLSEESGTRPAWIGNNKVELPDADPSKDNALTLEGDKPANFKVVPQHEAGEKLNRFVIEYDDYQVPLTLDGNPVVEGQIIHADEFDRLVWNGSQSEAGTIRYIAMNGDGDDAKELPNAKEGSIHVTESADVKAPAAPVAPSQPAPQASQGEVNDKEQPAGSNKPGQNANPDADNKLPGQEGQNNPGNKTPAPQDNLQNGHGNAGHGGHQDSTPAHQDAQGQGGTPPGGSVQAGSNTGGSSASGSTSNGSGSGTVHGEVTLPKAPIYNADHQTAEVGYNDKTAKIDAHFFKGDIYAQQPDAVKILNGGGHLLFKGKPVIDGETIVPKADFDKVAWDARNADGGEFHFIPVKANGEHIPEGEIDGKIDAQTIRIHEAAAPLPPRYPDGNSQTTHVGHDSVQKLDADLFNGSNGERKPAFIKITGFEETGATDDNAHSPLTLNKGGVAATEISTANGSNLVRQADFQNLLWDTSTNTGGTIRFIPVDQNGDPLPHTTEQTIHISEMSDQPYYGNDGQSVNVAHDEASHALKAEIFTGKDGKVPEAVKIDYIVDGKGNPITGAALTVGEGDNAKTIEARDFIDKADFARVHWNASLAEGGRFRFTAVDAQHQDIPGHVQNRTITIVEAPAPAANSGDEHAAETTQTGEHAAVTTQHEHQSQEAEQHSQEDKLTPPPKQEGEKTDTTTTDTTTPENGQKPAAGEEQHPGASGHDSQPSGEESGTPGSAPAGGKPAEGAGHGASEDPTGSQKPAGETGVGGGVQKDASDQQDPNATQSQGTDPKGEVVTEDHSSDPKASSTVPGGEKQESDSDKASGDPSDKGHAPPVSDPPETTHNENPSGGQNAVNQSGQSDSDSGKANVGGGDQQGNTGATQTHQAESAVNGQSGSDGVSELRHESAAHSPRSVLKSVHALQFDDLLSDDGQTYGEAPAPAHDSLYIHSSTDMGHLVPMNPEVTHL
ncbi:hypothetical protein EHV23_00375 [Lautropia dentalis]|uniref:Uncharacterized protein n=1 Tax=Lautropia dentalis TaxID=2490857 RepID=A0A3R8MRG4_9BURK|nr:C-type lectin domain-containing protein [Lautropia dentalis]RRN44790.1 hypothetical protein EHV23_00375 [Lautropia dentalis]